MDGNNKNARKVFGVIIVAGVLAALYGAASNSPPQSAPVTQPAAAPGPLAAPPAPEEPPMTKAEAAQALSTYMRQVHAQFFANSVLQQVIHGRIRQALQFRDLGKFQKGAEDLKESAMAMQNRLMMLPYPNNLEDQDQAAFDQVAERVSDVTGGMVEIAVDVAAAAHTGMDFTQDAEKDARELEKASAAMRKATLAAYKQFGIAANKIDKKNLTIIEK
ncbi:hypothetical protein [Herbaspirillum huttiense]|uniref:hypothetical protein n=1 Tax=Herbaspirillum huttiense TaxID=863372 RepID=UPI003B3ABBF2